MRPFLTGIIASISSSTILSGCCQYPMNGSSTGWYNMMGYGRYGGMFMWLIWILIGGILLYILFNRNTGNNNIMSLPEESALEIIKKRYAKGEITREEFIKLKADLED